MLCAVVLAAGFSRRMGSPKALLPDRDGCPFVVRIVRTLASAGVDDAIVVTSPELRDAIAERLLAADVPSATRVVVNPAPERGQLSSIWAGMEVAIRPDMSGMLLTLVDVPFVAVATVRAVIEAHAAGALIARPAEGDRHGHPVIFHRRLFAELRAADLTVGAKSVVRAHQMEIVNVPVADEGAFADIDTPADYDMATGARREPGTHHPPDTDSRS